MSVSQLFMIVFINVGIFVLLLYFVERFELMIDWLIHSTHSILLDWLLFSYVCLIQSGFRVSNEGNSVKPSLTFQTLTPSFWDGLIDYAMMMDCTSNNKVLLFLLISSLLLRTSVLVLYTRDSFWRYILVNIRLKQGKHKKNTKHTWCVFRRGLCVAWYKAINILYSFFKY